jgi:hypothetical protein
MSKLIVSSFVSLDGVIESPMTWTSPFFDDESKEYAYQQLADVGPSLPKLDLVDVRLVRSPRFGRSYTIRSVSAESRL